ncbi:MAG: hypothetical protein HQ518_06450 [Rhodopirellula sp.]|nr:hypothetical protein [Rhodopirellula sp.]
MPAESDFGGSRSDGICLDFDGRDAVSRNVAYYYRNRSAIRQLPPETGF